MSQKIALTNRAKARFNRVWA